MGSIIRVESCHDLPVQDSGGGVKFCEFAGNNVGIYMRNKIGLQSILLLAHFWKVSGGVGTFLRKSCSD